MTHIKWPNNPNLPPDETSWQQEAMQQNALLFQTLVRAEIAEKKLAATTQALIAAQTYLADLEGHIGAEGTSISTDYAAAAYHLALEKLEPSK